MPKNEKIVQGILARGETVFFSPFSHAHDIKQVNAVNGECRTLNV
jgi:hypothetical protein